jgi:hypothetical protein
MKYGFTFRYMPEIVRRVAIARHVFLNVDSSLEIRFQDIHLPITRVSVDILRQAFVVYKTHLVQKKNEGRTGE